METSLSWCLFFYHPRGGVVKVDRTPTHVTRWAVGAALLAHGYGLCRSKPVSILSFPALPLCLIRSFWFCFSANQATACPPPIMAHRDRPKTQKPCFTDSTCPQSRVHVCMEHEFPRVGPCFLNSNVRGLRGGFSLLCLQIKLGCAPSLAFPLRLP